MNKKVGEEIDHDIHADLLLSFTKFIENFSPLLDKAETYRQNILAENLISSSKENTEKLQLINDTVDLLNNMIPSFFKFAQLEDKLEKFHN